MSFVLLSFFFFFFFFFFLFFLWKTKIRVVHGWSRWFGFIVQPSRWGTGDSVNFRCLFLCCSGILWCLSQAVVGRNRYKSVWEKTLTILTAFCRNFSPLLSALRSLTDGRSYVLFSHFPPPFIKNNSSSSSKIMKNKSLDRRARERERMMIATAAMMGAMSVHSAGLMAVVVFVLLHPFITRCAWWNESIARLRLSVSHCCDFV